MIQDLDETLRQILVKQGKLNSGNIDIAFDQPTGEWTATLSRPTINLYLYDIRENTELRAATTYQVERNTNNGKARKVYMPKRVDLSYLITVWARNPEDEHQLLWRVLHTLSQYPIIKAETGVGVVQDQLFDMPMKVALPSDAVRNMPDLWGVMENQLKPSLNVVITVALDTQKAIEAPMVLTAVYRIGQSENPPNKVITAEDVSIYHIGGQVLDNKEPVGAGVEVELLDRGDLVHTDSEGRFIFAYLEPGEYDVEVKVEGRKPKRQKITVPDKHYNLSV
jgi:hypothetical protein